MKNRIAKVPQIMQMETVECGAASLAMILAYYGRWVPLEQLRVDCGVSRDGAKITNILKAARSYGLEAQGMRLTLDSLKEKSDIYPCIVFWNFNHYVVVDGFKGNKFYLNDPARGQITLSAKEFEDGYTGIALLFKKTDAFVPGGEKPNMLAYARSRLKGMETAILFVMLTAAVSSIAAIFYTSMGTVFLDHILKKDPVTDGKVQWLIPLILIMLILALAAGIVSVVKAVNIVRIQGKTAVVSSSRFMRHLLHLPVGFYSQRSVGDLQMRQSDNETIVFTLINQLAPVIINSVMLILYLVIMLKYSILLTAVGVFTVVLNAFVARWISQKRLNVARTLSSNNGKLYAATVGGIEMIETVKAAGAENSFFTKWSGYQALVNNGKTQITYISEYLGLIPEALRQLASIAVLVIGILLIIRGEFTPGSLLAFTGFLTAFMEPVSQFIGLGQTIQEMQTQMERIEDVMRYPADVPEEPEETDPVHERSAEKLRGELDLDNISFGYSPLEPPLIENLSLHLEPGKWVALVGGSGSGKSTVAKLITGLYPPRSGEIRFDGVPIKDIPAFILRSSVSMVDQDIVTFEDTIANNIKLWDRSIEDYEMILACRDAEIHSDIISRKNGYYSMVQPGGKNFSGGQLQRMEIAHALAEDPTILVLDEATSALDAQTEEHIIRCIRDRGISCVVVAHRLSTIRDCDEIIVLDNGKVAERGTHQELMKNNGAYAALVKNN